MSEVKHMDIREFKEKGYLQEANRRFFHPLGLALVVSRNDSDGSMELFGIQDSRDDPEGIVFDEFDVALATSVSCDMLARAEYRGKLPYCNNGGVQTENAS